MVDSEMENHMSRVFQSFANIIPKEIRDQMQVYADPEFTPEPNPRDKGSVFTLQNGKGEYLDVNVDMDEWPSKAAARIGVVLIADWFGHFLGKNAGYGDAQDTLEPASKVQYLEIHRKAGKLRRVLWDNLPIGPESPREVTMDLIGHCFLLLLALEKEDNG